MSDELRFYLAGGVLSADFRCERCNQTGHLTVDIPEQIVPLAEATMRLTDEADLHRLTCGVTR